MSFESNTKYYFNDFDKVLKNYGSRFYATCFYQDQMLASLPPLKIQAKMKKLLAKDGCKPTDRRCFIDADIGHGNTIGFIFEREGADDQLSFFSSASHAMCDDANYDYEKHKKAVVREARILDRLYKGDLSPFTKL